MAMKKGVWDTILKVIIAVASAVLGALGGSAMQANNKIESNNCYTIASFGKHGIAQSVQLK